MTFKEILKGALDATPNAFGVAFAAWDGEMVEGLPKRDAYDWAVLTAHYGVVLANLYAAFGTLHFGAPEMFLARHAGIDVIVTAVDQSYYILIAMDRPNADDDPYADAIATLARAADLLRKEIA